MGNEIAAGVGKEMINKIMDWLPSIQKKLSPFKPEITELYINYQKATSKIVYRLDLGDSNFRRKHTKIIIPCTERYRISSFLDASFTNLLPNITRMADRNNYYFKPMELPQSRHFRVELEGDIEMRYIKELVRIQPAVNKNSTPTYEKYWLSAMLYDVTTLEKIYNALEVSDINCFVDISIERYFHTSIPKNIKDALKAKYDFLLAGKGNDRGKLFKAWRKFKFTSISKEAYANFLNEIVENLYLKEYIKAEQPFRCGDISDIQHSAANIIPSSFSVEALTSLSLDQPAANGYLMFHKQNFQNKIKKEIEKSDQ